MKLNMLLFIISHLILINLYAQKKSFIADGEKLMIQVETDSIQAMLENYYYLTGNYFAVVSTDTITSPPDELLQKFTSEQGLDNDKNMGLALLLSRRQAFLFISGNAAMTKRTTAAELLELLNIGAPFLKGKRIARGITAIAQACMNFIDQSNTKRN